MTTLKLRDGEDEEKNLGSEWLRFLYARGDPGRESRSRAKKWIDQSKARYLPAALIWGYPVILPFGCPGVKSVARIHQCAVVIIMISHNKQGVVLYMRVK